MPTTAEEWDELTNAIATEMRPRDEATIATGESSFAWVLGPEVARALDEWIVEDAAESLMMIAQVGIVEEGRSVTEAVGSMLSAHTRIGIAYGLWLAARKGVRLP